MVAQQPQQYPLPPQVDKENIWDVYDYGLVMEELNSEDMQPKEINWDEAKLKECSN